MGPIKAGMAKLQIIVPEQTKLVLDAALEETGRTMSGYFARIAQRLAEEILEAKTYRERDAVLSRYLEK